jgi:hypothetical protein
MQTYQQVASFSTFVSEPYDAIVQEFVMAVSSRLVAFAAAVAITALTFAGPTFAAPYAPVHPFAGSSRVVG